MTSIGPAPSAARTVATTTPAPFVEWGPIFAGALLAAALSFVLLTFGTAIGLSAASPWPNVGVSGKVIASLAVFWVLAQQIGAFLAGGYIAGRMRTRWAEAPQSEAEFRDGVHGGLVWALGIVIGATLIMATAGAVARTGTEVAGKAAVSVASTGTMDAVLDTLLRPAAQQPGAPGTARPSAPTAASPDVARASIARILARSVASGSVSNDDRSYLVQLVSQQTGLPQQEAEARLNAAFNAAREGVDKARRAAILTGLVTAISLIVSFGAAWWAALKGGQHRDNAVPARFDFGTRRYGARPS